MHFIKLDKTYTGLQTLGAETVVDIWLQEVNNLGQNGPGSLSITPSSTRPNSPLEGITIPASVAENVIEESETLSTDKSTNDQETEYQSVNSKVQNDIECEEQCSTDAHVKQLVGNIDLDVGKMTENGEDNIEAKTTIKSAACGSTIDYCVPIKKATVEKRSSKSSAIRNKNSASKVKPGSSLLLRKKMK